jgi:hypothetical protein
MGFCREKIRLFLAFHPTTLVAEEASEYKAPFQLRQYQSLDGTPLATAIAVHQDSKPHPGVVLAHGFTETKNQKYIVEPSGATPSKRLARSRG